MKNAHEVLYDDSVKYTESSLFFYHIANSKHSVDHLFKYTLTPLIDHTSGAGVRSSDTNVLSFVSDFSLIVQMNKLTASPTFGPT